MKLPNAHPPTASDGNSEPTGFHLTPAQAATVAAFLTRALVEPGYPYPWDGLETRLRETGRSELVLVGYGSLVNAASAARTLHNVPVGALVPAVAFGARRLFHYEMPPAVRTRYAIPADPLARALLNAVQTGDPGDVLNGIRFTIPLTDIPALREREIGYDLRPVVSVAWGDPGGEVVSAYVLCCPEWAADGSRLINSELRPHPDYYRLCRAGAASISDDFLRFWLSTSYLADGVTPVAEWEATLPT